MGRSAKRNECIVFWGLGQRWIGTLLGGFIPLKGRFRVNLWLWKGERRALKPCAFVHRPHYAIFRSLAAAFCCHSDRSEAEWRNLLFCPSAAAPQKISQSIDPISNQLQNCLPKPQQNRLSSPKTTQLPVNKRHAPDICTPFHAV